MPRREQNDERILSIVHKTLGDVAGPGYRPRAVWISHSQVGPISAYRKVFGVTPLFNQPTMGIAVESDLLDSWRLGRSDKMREMAEAYLIEKAGPRGKKFSQSVAEMARRMLAAAEFTPEHTAAELGLHPRTLQRRLKEEGTNFERIKDEARRQWAEALLAQPSVSLGEIAEMLGYADLSALSRSCKRWFGESPRDYRARMRARPPQARASRVNSLEANLRARRRADV
jgi:AraC-like DNA-binding protein